MSTRGITRARAAQPRGMDGEHGIEERRRRVVRTEALAGGERAAARRRRHQVPGRRLMVQAEQSVTDLVGEDVWPALVREREDLQHAVAAVARRAQRRL